MNDVWVKMDDAIASEVIAYFSDLFIGTIASVSELRDLIPSMISGGTIES